MPDIDNTSNNQHYVMRGARLGKRHSHLSIVYLFLKVNSIYELVWIAVEGVFGRQRDEDLAALKMAPY